MRVYSMLSALYSVCILSQVDEVPAGSMPDAASGEAGGGTAPTDGALEGAPGCETPKPDRTVFPGLIAAGGKFRSQPDASGAVHFDVNLVPTIKDKDGKDIAGLPEWPRTIDAATGKPIPLPWEGHSRLANKALTADCFDTETGYFLYRAYEAYEKAQTALQHYNTKKFGVAKSVVAAQKKTAIALDALNTLAATLSPEAQAEVARVMEMLNAMKNTPIAPAPAAA